MIVIDPEHQRGLRDAPLGPPAAPVPSAVQYPSPIGAPPPPRKRKTALVVGGIAALLVAFAAGGFALSAALHRGAPAPAASGPPAVATVTMFGTLTLKDSAGVLNLDDVHCEGMGGYSDIVPGAQITVTDESGAVIGVSQLSDGSMIGSGFTRQCDFTFTVNNLPGGHQFYGVSVTRRGSIQVQASEVENVQVTLG